MLAQGGDAFAVAAEEVESLRGDDGDKFDGAAEDGEPRGLFAQ